MNNPYSEIVELLTKNELTISTCESITGGMISSMIVNIPGASKVFKGGLVVYSNYAKMNLANVNAKTLEKFGAISKECAIEMAANTAKKFRSDISIAVTGNAGPTSDENKPVGQTFLAITVIDKTYWYELNSKLKERNDIRVDITALALEKTISLIKKLIK